MISTGQVYLQEKISASLFDGVPGGEADWLIDQASLTHFRHGTNIYNQGDPGHGIFLVVHGEVGIYSDNRLLRVCRVGDSFGEHCALSQQPRAHTALAMTRADVLFIPGQALLSMFNHGYGQRLLVNLANMLTMHPMPMARIDYQSQTYGNEAAIAAQM